MEIALEILKQFSITEEDLSKEDIKVSDLVDKIKTGVAAVTEKQLKDTYDAKIKEAEKNAAQGAYNKVTKNFCEKFGLDVENFKSTKTQIDELIEAINTRFEDVKKDTHAPSDETQAAYKNLYAQTEEARAKAVKELEALRKQYKELESSKDEAIQAVRKEEQAKGVFNSYWQEQKAKLKDNLVDNFKDDAILDPLLKSFLENGYDVDLESNDVKLFNKEKQFMTKSEADPNPKTLVDLFTEKYGDKFFKKVESKGVDPTEKENNFYEPKNEKPNIEMTYAQIAAERIREYALNSNK